MTPWQTTPTARRVLNAIKPTDLHVRLDRPLIGPDALILSGEVIEQLGEIREQHHDSVFGCDFREAMNDSRAHEYLDALAEQPEVQTVLADMFGDPNLLRGWGAEKAQDMWRAAFPVREERRAA